jgi:hypothetical protein
LYTSPGVPRSKTVRIASQWSSTYSQSRTFIPSPYSGIFLPSSRFVTNSGIAFSGKQYGP